MWGLFLPTPGTRISAAAAACLSGGDLLGPLECLRVTEGQAVGAAEGKFAQVMDKFRAGLAETRVTDPVLVQLLDRVGASGDVSTALARAGDASKYVRASRTAVASPAPSLTVRRFASVPETLLSPGDPWLPPSQYSHSGVADVTGMVQGGGHPAWPVETGLVPVVEVLKPGPGAGSACYRQVLNARLTREGSGAISPSDLGYRIDHDWQMNCPNTGYPDLLIKCAAPLAGFTNDVGIFNPWGWTTYNYGHSNKANNASDGLYHDWYTNVGCGSGLLFVSAEISIGGFMDEVHEGLRVYTPVLRQLPGSLSATCSDGTVVTSTAATALDLSVVCGTGVRSVTVASGGTTVGQGGVTAGFSAWPCLVTATACHFVAVAGGVSYSSLDGGGWWAGTAAADDCGWVDTGSGQMWSLAAADCEAARHDGVVDPTGHGSLSPSPSPGSDPVLEAVKRILEGIASDVGRIKSWLEGIGSAFDRAKSSADDSSHGINASQAQGIVNWWGPLMGKIPGEAAYSVNCGFVIELLGHPVPLCPLESMIPVMTKLRELADVAIPLTLLVNLLWSLALTFRLHGDGGR
jgi:hypothetical protein